MSKRATNGSGTTASDGAERDGFETRLGDPEGRYRALIEHVPAVIYVEAVEGVSSPVYISPQIEAMLGYAPEEWLVDGEFFMKLLHPEDRERVLAEKGRTKKSGETFDTEYRLIARDGRTVWARDEAVLVRDEKDRPLFWRGDHGIHYRAQSPRGAPAVSSLA